jgi:two-component system sensor histidine kinase KdpD
MGVAMAIKHQSAAVANIDTFLMRPDIVLTRASLDSVRHCQGGCTIRPMRDYRGYAVALITVALATAIGWLMHRLQLADTNILMLYLLGVLWVATHHGRGASVLASVLGVLAFDFVFVPPYWRLTVQNEQYLVTFAVMLLTALTISTLTHNLRRRDREARAAWERVEAEFLRNTLLSGVSHELRTPLAGITGASSTLIENGESLSPEERREMLETVYGEAERMERLINNLLDMTRLESGGLTVKKEWLPLQEVIGSALQHMDRRLAGRRVTTRLEPKLPLVNVDPVAMEQVLCNLLDNAVQYTPAGSTIDMSAEAKDGRVQIAVADRGPGLPAGAENRVFEKFFRAHNAAQTRRGIGLGLAICRGIVEAHGGQITAANREDGGGAVFRISLPLASNAPAVDSSA